jgi:hypothetical protein
MKSMGERGSPCLSPLPCRIGSSGMPFNITLDDDVVRSAVIQLHHFRGKPLRCRRVSR